jgi:RNA polymerase sigma factor (sigma-70 family)
MLYERFYGFSLKVVFRYIYRYDKAVDAVNDGFVKLFTHFSKFEAASAADAEKQLMGWIRRIMVNTAIDELRKDQLLPEIGELSETHWEEPATSGYADENVLYKELMAQVKKLPPAYRAVFNMFVIDGFSHNEIAGHLDISVGTSKSNLSKAKEYLRKAIYKDNPINPQYATFR